MKNILNLKVFVCVIVISNSKQVYTQTEILDNHIFRFS